jgi:hypothetical protein
MKSIIWFLLFLSFISVEYSIAQPRNKIVNNQQGYKNSSDLHVRLPFKQMPPFAFSNYGQLIDQLKESRSNRFSPNTKKNILIIGQNQFQRNGLIKVLKLARRLRGLLTLRGFANMVQAGLHQMIVLLM